MHGVAMAVKQGTEGNGREGNGEGMLKHIQIRVTLSTAKESLAWVLGYLPNEHAAKAGDCHLQGR